MDIKLIKQYLEEKLAKGLNPLLTYHSIYHTLDVFKACNLLAAKELVNGRELLLLQVAALYHDAGMLRTYKSHEEASADIAREDLPDFGFDEQEVDQVCAVILTTKLPQSASGKLDKILCDADLDYLGRNDFLMISHKLKYEWAALDVSDYSLTEWYQLQLSFLENHSYFTKAAIELRQKTKEKNLLDIKELLGNHIP